jgi:acyl carrier protein
MLKANRRDGDRSSSRVDGRSRRDRLVAFIESLDIERTEALSDDTSLIASGLLDSLALFNLVSWIEGEIGSPVDLTRFELWQEWETVGGVLGFIARHRGGDGRPA